MEMKGLPFVVICSILWSLTPPRLSWICPAAFGNILR